MQSISPKKVKWRMWQGIEAGILSPLKAVENEVKAYCWQHGLKCEVMKSGWLVKDVKFLVSGESTEKEARQHASTLRKWFLGLENT